MNARILSPIVKAHQLEENYYELKKLSDGRFHSEEFPKGIGIELPNGWPLDVDPSFRDYPIVDSYWDHFAESQFDYLNFSLFLKEVDKLSEESRNWIRRYLRERDELGERLIEVFKDEAFEWIDACSEKREGKVENKLPRTHVLTDFGYIYLVGYDGYNGRNPRTGESIWCNGTIGPHFFARQSFLDFIGLPNMMKADELDELSSENDDEYRQVWVTDSEFSESTILSVKPTSSKEIRLETPTLGEALRAELKESGRSIIKGIGRFFCDEVTGEFLSRPRRVVWAELSIATILKYLAKDSK